VTELLPGEELLPEVMFPITPSALSPMALLASQALSGGVTPPTALEYLKALPVQRMAETEIPSGEQLGPVSGPIKSFLSALVPEALGFDPLLGVEQYRAENPILGLGTEIAGFGAGYLTGAGIASRVAGRAVPALARTVGGLGVSATESGVLPSVTSAFGRAGLREVARFAPFEAIRVGNAAAFTDSGNERVNQALVNLAFGGVVGGAFGALARGRPARLTTIRGEEKLGQVFDEWNLNWAPQEKLARLNVFKGTDAYSSLLEGDRALIDEVSDGILKEIESVWPSGNVVGKLAHGDRNTSAVNGLFRRMQGEAEKSGAFASYKLTDAKLLTQMPEIGERLARFLPERWQEYAAFPTVLKVNSPDGAKRLAKIMKDSLPSISDGWYMNRELGQDGLYVMARKIKGGAAHRASDHWILFKTNAPRMFARKQDSLLRTMESTAWALEQSPTIGSAWKYVRQGEEKHVPAGFELRARARAPGTSVNLPGQGIGLAKDVKPVADLLLDPQAQWVGGTVEPSKIGELWQKAVRGLGDDSLASDLAVGANTLKHVFKNYFAPSNAKFSDSLSGARAQLLIKEVADRARARVVRATAGRLGQGFRQPTGPSDVILRGAERNGGIFPLIDEMEERTAKGIPALQQFSAAVFGKMSLVEAASHKMDASVLRTLSKLREMRLDSDRDLILATEAYGLKPMTMSSEYYLISRGWRGNLRLPLYVKGENGAETLIDFASGNSRAEVMREAEALRAALKEKGFDITWKKASAGTGRFRKDFPEELRALGAENDLELMNMISEGHPAEAAAREARLQFVTAPARPGRLQPIRLVNAQGFAGGLRPLTGPEIKSKIAANLWEKERYIGEAMVRNKLLQPTLSRLGGVNPGTAPVTMLGGMMKDLGGEFPLVAEWLNRYTFQAFGKPVPNSISEAIDRAALHAVGVPLSSVTRALNQAMFHLTFGALDVGFPVLNATTYLQTGMPEVMFTLRAPTKALQKYYSTALIPSSKGTVAMSHIEPLKLAKVAMDDFRKMTKDKDVWADVRWALDNGVVSPRFVEEYVGELSGDVTASALRRGDVDILKFLLEADKLPAAKSEEFVRMHSFLLGRRLAKDFRGLEGEKANLFAKRFTERTMFNYSTADRAAVMTGPIGSAWGMFKNWPAHYIWNMMAYVKHGIKTGDVAPLAWAMAGTGAVGGLTAVPGYFALDAFSRFAADKDAVSAVYEGMGADGDSLPLDAIFYGLPSFLGVSLSSRAAAPFSDPLRDVNSLFSIATWERAKAFANVSQSTIDTFTETGRGPGESAKVFDEFMKALAPRWMYRAHQTTADGAIRSLKTGNQLIGDLDLAERLGYIMGLPSTQVMKSFDVSSELWRRQESRKEAVTLLGEEYAQLLEERDVKGLANLLRRAAQMGIDPASVHASGEARFLNANEELMDRQFKEYNDYKTKHAVLGR
jgi:hypothetical protein